MKLIPLNIIQKKSKGNGLFAKVDDEDYDFLMQYNWFAHKSKNTHYAETNGISNKTIKMHRLIMNPPPDMLIDHINRDGLDNQKSNLRICNYSQNNLNRIFPKSKSKYRGVYFERGKWISKITISLGVFKTEQDAANAFNEAHAKRHLIIDL